MKDTERVPEPADEPLFAHEDGEPRFETDSAEDLFEEVALPEDESSATRQFVTWREIPADDPSGFPPQTVERWSDQLQRLPLPQSKPMVLVALACTAVAVGGFGYFGLLVTSSRPQLLADQRVPATSQPVLPRAPVGPSTVARGAPIERSVPTEPVVAAPTPEAAPPSVRESPPPVKTAPPAPAVRQEPTNARAPIAADIGVVRTERAATPSAPPVRPAPVPPPAPPPASRAVTDAPASTASSAAVTTAPAPPAFVPYVPVQPEPVAAAAVTSPPPAASTAAAVAVVPDDVRLRQLMDRYRAAFSSLDANEVRQVWPSVDTRGLSRAFGQLSAQRFEFSACDIAVNGDRGVAACSGTAEYVTKVGSKSPKWDPRDWTFEFRRIEQEWRIQAVVTR